MQFAHFGGIRMGVTSHFTAPVSIEEAFSKSVHQHKVLRGKPIPQSGGQNLDKITMSFFFDESFCDPAIERQRLIAEHETENSHPFVLGDGQYSGKHYWITSLSNGIKRTKPNGKVVQFDAKLTLLEVPKGARTVLRNPIAMVGRAILNPLLKRF